MSKYQLAKLNEESWCIKKGLVPFLFIEELKEYLPLIPQEKIDKLMSEDISCEKDCRRMFEKGELRKGVTVEGCVKILC